MAAYLPEHAVACEAECLREAVRIRRLKIEGQTIVVGRPAAVDVIVCRDEAHLFPGKSCPDIGQVEHPQRFARRQVHRNPKPANHYGLVKGGSVYPCDDSNARTPSSALPCCSTALAKRVFASSRAPVVRRCSAIRKATRA